MSAMPKAVSYTHLDVYKRQGTARQVRIANCPRAIRVITAPARTPAENA